MGKVEAFYVVMRGDLAQTSASVRHATESEARDEARRLCQKTGKPLHRALVYLIHLADSGRIGGE